MEFKNDPVVDELPRFGAGRGMLLAERTRCGEAFVWEPGADAEALVAFVGEQFLVVQGQVYERDGELLRPVDWLREKRVVIKPPAGDVLFVHPDQVAAHWAFVVAPEWRDVPVDKPDVETLNASFALVDGSAQPSTESGVPPVAPVAGAGDGEQAAPEVVAASPAPAKRGPGRPAGSKNKPKDGE